MAADLRAHLQAILGGAYVFERELGGGGMGRLFLAEETALGRRVVVKVLPPEVSGAVSAERFRREVQLAARLQHPHIVPLLTAGEGGGLLYYTMPYVAGETLRDRLARDGALPVAAAVRVIRDVARALAHAHRHGVVHRDVKPENILLGEDDDALVADFGIAKALAAATGGPAAGPLTSAGFALGTPAYMAPEQALGDAAVDHRADLYALGVVAYEALAGSHPFAGRPAQALLAAHATEPPEPLARRQAGVPAALAALVMRLLGKDPADRPRSADEILNALDALGVARRAGARLQSPAARRPPARRRGLLVAGLGLLLLAGAGAYAASRTRPGSRLVAARLPAARPSVAVLPFANTSGDSADEHFSDGLTDELIAALSRLGTLNVIARTSSFALKGQALDIRTVGDTLHVGAVVEGSVRRSGDRLKITAQLVGTHDAGVLWAQSFDRELKDVFAVQEEIARAIVAALQGTLVDREGGAGAPLVRPATADLAAYDLYLRGRLFFNQRTRHGLIRAVDYFEQAAARDPGYARAYAGLADARILLTVQGHRPPLQEVPRARAAATQALALDSTLAEAHVALAQVLFAFDWNWPAAGQEIDRAIALDPNYAWGWHVRGIYLLDQGRLADAEAALRQALALDPLSAPASMNLGRVYLAARRPDTAVAQLRDALELNPVLPQTHLQLGHAYLQRGTPADAVAAFRQAAALGSVSDSAQLAYGLAVTGARAEAEAVLRVLLASGDRRYLPPVGIAMAYTGLDDRDAAFRWLERAYGEHAAYLDALTALPAFAPLHADSRWTRHVRRIGLEP